MSRRIENKGARISLDTIQGCFESGKVLHVDKVICGNGFSTAFLKLKPSEGHINIIIMPNKGAIKSKELDYSKDRSKYNHNRIGFFYKEGKGGDLSNLDCAVFVADSFLTTEAVKEVSVDKLLIDEFHSVEKASSYRHNLKDLIHKVSKRVHNISDASISSVTATPNLSSRVDIVIENEVIKPIDIQVSIDTEGTIEAIREHIKNNERVIIFTQNASTIEAILKPKHNQFRKEAIPVNWIVGSSLTEGVLEVVKYKQDIDSNIVIASSKGFEGLDIEEHSDWNIYFFEDRSSEIESYLLPNLYQAIHRTRAGHKSVTYCRADRKDSRGVVPSGLKHFIERDDITGESKMGKGKDSSFTKFHKYVIFESIEGSPKVLVKENEVAVRLLTDAIEWDIPASSLHRANGKIEQFCKERGVSFIAPCIEERANRTGRSCTKSGTKEKYLKSNEGVIEELGFFGSSYKFSRAKFDADLKTSNTFEQNIKELQKNFAKFQRRRNYKGSDRQELIPRREYIFAELLSHPSRFKALIRKSIRAKKSEYKARVNDGVMTRAKYYRKIQGIDMLMPLFVMRYACDMVNETISHRPKKIGHRDYNVTIEGSLESMRVIADHFDVTFQEVDIRSCNIRIVYNSQGYELPTDIYGENKEHKGKLNAELNMVTYVQDLSNDSDYSELIRHHRNKRVKALRSISLKEDVIEYLIDTYMEAKHKGRFTHDMGYHEKQVIDRLRDKKEGRIDYSKNEGVSRRHDSLIIYNNAEDLTNINTAFTYMNHSGWFDVKYIPLEYQEFLKDCRLERDIIESQGLDSGLIYEYKQCG